MDLHGYQGFPPSFSNETATGCSALPAETFVIVMVFAPAIRSSVLSCEDFASRVDVMSIKR